MPGKLVAVLICGSAFGYKGGNAIVVALGAQLAIVGALGAGSNANAEASTACIWSLSAKRSACRPCCPWEEPTCAACAVSGVMAGTGAGLLVEPAPVRANV